MSAAVVAHAGHWLIQVAYLAPLVLLVAVLVVGRLQARREERAERDSVTPPTP